MTTIYLVRHGQASFGKANYDELSPTGQSQAELLGQYFKQILSEAPYVVAGTMKRHMQTAQGALKQCFPEANIHTHAGGMSLIINRYLQITTHALNNLNYLNKRSPKHLIRETI